MGWQCEPRANRLRVAAKIGWGAKRIFCPFLVWPPGYVVLQSPPVVQDFILKFLVALVPPLIVIWVERRHDPSTKQIERQTKRLEFWKAFHELEVLDNQVHDEEHQKICRMVMKKAVSALPTKTEKISRKIALWFSLVCWVFGFITLVNAPRFASITRVLIKGNELIVFPGVIFVGPADLVVVYVVIYPIIKKNFLKALSKSKDPSYSLPD